MKTWGKGKKCEGPSEGTQHLTDSNSIKKEQRKPKKNIKMIKENVPGPMEMWFPDYTKYHSELIRPKRHYEIWEHQH